MPDVRQFLGNAQQLVVFGGPVAPRRAPGLDLARAGRHRQVGNERVFRFARAVGNHRVVAVQARQLDALERYRARLARQREFAGLVAAQRDRLAAIYASGDAAAGMRLAKADAFDQMRGEYEVLKQGWGGSGDYDFWFDNDPNNASLVAVTSYQRWVPGLRSRLDALGAEAFYLEVEALQAQEPDERTATLEAWNRASAAIAVANGR